MSTVIPLRQLSLGVQARIVSVSAVGELGRRIRDMGLVPGTAIEIIGRAPLRDPVAVRLQGFTLSLRNSEADFVTVEPLVLGESVETVEWQC
ncbi:MAG: FeoA family protein [Desulfovibrionaceae bacterium]